MNPYWINPKPDTDDFLRSDAVKGQFFLLVAGHVVLWLAALLGIVFIYLHAQKAPQIDAFTAGGEPAWGRPMPVGSADTLKQRETFLDMHLRSVFTHLFMRTEKGTLPALKDYTDPVLLAILERDFNFVKDKKGGYSQSFYIQEFEKMLGDGDARRRVYRIHGTLSAHSLEGSSNTPIYLLAAIDRRPATQANPLGWVVTVLLAVDDKAYYSPERQALINEVTQAENALKNSPNNSVPNK